MELRYSDEFVACSRSNMTRSIRHRQEKVEDIFHWFCIDGTMPHTRRQKVDGDKRTPREEQHVQLSTLNTSKLNILYLEVQHRSATASQKRQSTA